MESGPTPAELLAIAGGGWGYAEAEWIGGWHARASSGFTCRANCAWPLAATRECSPRELAPTLRAVHDWYAERGLPALVQCIAGSALDRAIADCGHHGVEQAALRQTARLSTIVRALEPSETGAEAAASAPTSAFIAADLTVTLADRPSPAWLRIYRSGGLPAVAEQVLGAGEQNVCFATVSAVGDGTALAIGRAALVAARVATGTAPSGAPSGWVGLAAVETAPAARRRGLAKIVLKELLTWAAERGAGNAFLEVTPANLPAIALYRSLGFSTHHAYHYRVIESRAVARH